MSQAVPLFRRSVRLGPAGAVAAGVLMSACALPLRPIIPAPLDVPAQASTPANLATEQGRPQTRVEALPVAPEAVPSKKAAPAVPPPAQSARLDAPADINLEQVSLATFAQLVFADVLKRNVNIDPQVLARKDLVTFRSGATQDAGQIEHAAHLLLKSYGVAAIDLGGLVRVVPDNATVGHLPEIVRGAALPDTPMPMRPVFQLLELQAVRPTEVSGWLRTLFGERVKSQEDISRNALLLSGTPDNLRAAIEAIRVLDQPVLAGAQSAAVTPVYWSADELARRLYEVLTAQGYAVAPVGPLAAGGVRYPIMLLPVSGLNAVFIFARGPEVLKHVTDWVRQLDRPNERGIGKNFFTYAVKHKDASILARTMEQLMGGPRAPTAPAAGGQAVPTAPASTRVVVDAATNTLIFQASQDEYSQLTSLLQTLDRPTKSALIEVTVAELSIDDNSQLGVEWLVNRALSGGGRLTAGTLGGLSVGGAGLNINVFDSANVLRGVINALASENKATILSSPRILARNGEQATIQVGEEVPIVTSQQSTPNATTTGSAQVLQTIQYRNTGVILGVKPVIHSGDQIDLDVTQEVSSAQSTNTGVNNSPTFSTRKISTKLTLKNGATVLLGGLISDESSQGNSGIPGLKSLPVVGNLFRSDTTGGRRRELIVLITPYVINDDHDAQTITNAFRKSLGAWAAGTAPATPAANADGGADRPANPLRPAQ